MDAPITTSYLASASEDNKSAPASTVTPSNYPSYDEERPVNHTTEAPRYGSYMPSNKKIKLESTSYGSPAQRGPGERFPFPPDTKQPVPPYNTEHSTTYSQPSYRPPYHGPSHMLPSSGPQKPTLTPNTSTPSYISRGYTTSYARPPTETKTRRVPNAGRRGPRGKSNYRGVCITREGKWRSVIYKDRKQVYLGVYDSEIEAAQAYDRASREYFGENANLNLPNELPRDMGPIVLPSAAKAAKAAQKVNIPKHPLPPIPPTVSPATKIPLQKLNGVGPGQHYFDTNGSQFDSIALEAQLFDPSDNILLQLDTEGPFLGDADVTIGPMSPLPSLFEGEWHEMSFV